MALSKQALQKLLDNPGMFSAADMEEETPEIPGLEEAPMAPEEMLEPSMDEESEVSPEAPEMDELEAPEGEIEMASAKPAMLEADQDIMAKLKKLKAGEPLDEMSDMETQDIAGDTEAPADLRKKALQKIKQKYLGQ